jgi:23S rRNA pseudouridine1911/1915/1917 synthase
MSMLDRHIIVDETMVDQRIDQALSDLLPEYSRNQFKQWLLSAEILLDDKAVKPKDKLKLGQHIHIHARLPVRIESQAQALPLEIIYEDNSILIINKPAGLVVHPGAGNTENTLMNALLHHHPDSVLIPRAGIVHRLDKETTGLMVVAKTLIAYNKLVDDMQLRHIQREYEAVIEGILVSGGTIDEPIGRHPTKRTQMAVLNQGKPATTHYRVLERFDAHTHIRLILETGRTHQIRVHMAHIRHPIVGDPVYGGRPKLPKGASNLLINTLKQFKRQALHAIKLSLDHPVTQERLSFEMSLPQDMQNLIDQLKHDNEDT